MTHIKYQVMKAAFSGSLHFEVNLPPRREGGCKGNICYIQNTVQKSPYCGGVVVNRTGSNNIKVQYQLL